jgi:uncharacterized protein involved in outer membrane biogenesis
MKTLLAVTAALALSACSGLDRKIDEATYKHYPQYSEAKRAECRAKAEPIYWEKATGGANPYYTNMARLEAANAYEACMES